MNPLRISALASLALAGPALAQVSMVDAIAISEAAVANRRLVEISREIDGGRTIWWSEFVNADLTNVLEIGIDASTGAIIEQEFEPIGAEDLAAYQAIVAIPDGALVTFAEAVAAAQQAAGTAQFPVYGEIEFNAGILAYEIEFLPSQAWYYVDATTGAVLIENGNDASDEDITTPAAMLSAIDAAFALNALPVLEAEVEYGYGRAGNAASVVEVLQWDAKTARLVETTVDVGSGNILSTIAFTPSGNQLARLQPVIAALGSITVSFADALNAAFGDHPGALGVHEIELEAVGTGIFFEVELVNAQGFEIDVYIDAMGQAQRSSVAGVNYHPCDYDRDGRVQGNDLAELLAVWGTMNPGYDLDGDQIVTGVELGFLLAAWN